MHTYVYSTPGYGNSKNPIDRLALESPLGNFSRARDTRRCNFIKSSCIGKAPGKSPTSARPILPEWTQKLVVIAFSRARKLAYKRVCVPG